MTVRSPASGVGGRQCVMEETECRFTFMKAENPLND